jgi:adenylate kinase
MKKNIINVIPFGPPGCGKGTISPKIVEKYGLFHISTGDICRERAKIEDELGLQIQAIMASGKYVSDDIIIRLFKEVAEANLSVNGFIFDGFPRTLEQVALFESFLAENFSDAQNKFILLDVSEEELLARLAIRAGIQKRADDASVEKVKSRIETFKKQTHPVIDYYANRHLITTVVGTGKTPETVWAEVQHIIDN